MPRHPLQSPRPRHSLAPEPATSSDALKWCAEAPREGLQLYASGAGSILDVAGRTDLLRAVRAGEPVELELEIDAFIQRETPNRNFVRFKPGILATFAKSFEGQPMLRDHASGNLLARGGTITASKLVHNDDGSKTIRMRLKLVKPWAVEAALDGTLDRFSIGWNRTGPVNCSACQASIMKCDHWIGDKVGDHVVQLEFTGADGTELSGINVPAVVGTKVHSISQLSAIDRTALADILADDTTGSSGDQKHMMNPKILAALVATLGISATATEDEIATALEAHADKTTIAGAQTNEIQAKLAKLEKDSADRALADTAAAIEGGIASLIAAGKLKPDKDPKSLESALRRSGARDLEVFRASVADMLAIGAAVTPVGAQLHAAKPDPQPTALADGKAFLNANPETAKWCKLAGITEEQFEKHGGNGREIVAAMQSR